MFVVLDHYNTLLSFKSMTSLLLKVKNYESGDSSTYVGIWLFQIVEVMLENFEYVKMENYKCSLNMYFCNKYSFFLLKIITVHENESIYYLSVCPWAHIRKTFFYK